MKPLYLRAIEAAATLDELEALTGCRSWNAESLRSEAPVVAVIEAELAGATS